MRLFNQKQKSRVCCRPAVRPAVQKGWTCPADSPYQALWFTVPERTCSEHQVSPEYPQSTGPQLTNMGPAPVHWLLGYD